MGTLDTPDLGGDISTDQLAQVTKSAALAAVGAKGSESLQNDISGIVDKLADMLDAFPEDD